MISKKGKIIATLGPASNSLDLIKQMIETGLDVCRINFSHGSRKEHEQSIKNIREADRILGTHTAILADLQGPKLRVGNIPKKGKILKEGEIVEFTTDEKRVNAKNIFMNYPEFASDVKKDERILLDDGKLSLVVVETDKDKLVRAKVVHGGVLLPNKGVNLPNTHISLPSLTKKDKEDLEFILEREIDWVGLSFVRSARDIIELKHLIKSKEKHARVVAKIEKPEAINEIDDIVKETDALMVARGDLGVEIPLQNVPLIQKMIIATALRNAKPVIVATQMMESMIENYTPTRAEVNDVANAILDGADAVMLSAETSIGKYPVRVIEVMNKIVTQIETSDKIYYHNATNGDSATDRLITDSVCFNAVGLSKRVSASAIITMTFSGYTAFKVSSHRPKSNIFVFTGNKKLLSQLSLVWGVRCFFYDKMVSTDHTIEDIKYILKKRNLVKDGDMVIHLASMPINEGGKTNMLKLSEV